MLVEKIRTRHINRQQHEQSCTFAQNSEKDRTAMVPAHPGLRTSDIGLVSSRFAMAMPQLRILVKTERENIDTRYQKNLRRLVSPMLIFTIIFYRIITNPSSSSNNIILQITELRRGRNVGCQRH